MSTKPVTKPLRTGGGVPAPSNPTFALALPGPAPLGVPNFFIDSFQIPPFLLPVYQAAGIEYQVPWQVLAAINEVETNYGRNLSVSTAGAVGWMQFMPSTWKTWGVDANGDGVKDPYNPVDAIFSAARYLQAAGAAMDLGKAIFAYNHADWYVQGVLLRAKLIGGMPSGLVGALTGLVQGHFPVAAPARYADDRGRGVRIFAASGSPVIAVNDGKVVAVGAHTIKLQDQTGNVYTYAGLGSVASRYAMPRAIRETAAGIEHELRAAATAAVPRVSGASAAGAGIHATLASVTRALPKAPAQTAPADSAAAVSGAVKERLFAHPSRAASYSAGGAQQLADSSQEIASFRNYFTSTLHLARDQYTLKPLREGSIVTAGTILGRIGDAASRLSAHVLFKIQPAGAPQIDPKPILDGWKLLEATAVYRADGQNPFYGPGAHNATVGQILLMSKEQLQQRVLTDPHVRIYACGKRDIAAGTVDRRVLAVIEYLSATGLDPTVSGLVCGNPSGAGGNSVNITALDNLPVTGHQGNGSITDLAIRRLLTLQGAIEPDQIISLMSYKGEGNTLALPDHADRLQISYTPQFGINHQLTERFKSALDPGQWINLIQRIGQIPEPTIPTTPSRYAVRAGG